MMKIIWGYLVSLFLIILISILGNEVQAAKRTVVSAGESIQAALDRAEAGDTLFVEKGTYQENVIIEKKVSLISNDAIIQGSGKGNVVTITASGVMVDGFTIKGSGRRPNDAGVLIQGSHNVVKNNTLNDVHVGIYVDKGGHNVLQRNRITSYSVHFSQRGNGIHLYKTNRNEILENTISRVQDGIYFDFATDTQVRANNLSDSRYGLHFMYAKAGEINDNHVYENITGLMIMGSANLAFSNNVIEKQQDYRGYGVLIFDSEKVTLARNQLIFNSTALSLQDARNSTITENQVSGNHVGLFLKDDNKGNVLTKNEFTGNVVQTRVSALNEPLDNGEIGNFWDDYRGLDVNGDGIGEIPYQSGVMYDRLLMQHPEYQFYFESPAVKLWAAVERLLPSVSTQKGVDRYPLIEPLLNDEGVNDRTAGKVLFMLIPLCLLVLGFYLFYRFMKITES